MNQAIYYPSIDVQDTAWLKTALLYWDCVRTIVPESMETPYSTQTGKALQNAGFLLPLRVHSDMEEIDELTVDVMTYLDTHEGSELIFMPSGGRRNRIHLDKLPSDLRIFTDIHSEKFPYQVRDLLRHYGVRQRRGEGWMTINEKFSNFYLTLLATRLAERVGAKLLTPLPAADRLSIAARLDGYLHTAFSRRTRGLAAHPREYEAFGPRTTMPRQLAPGMLAQLAIERVSVDPETPLKKLIDFRQKYGDELARFRNKIEELASTVEADLPLEALRQRVSEVYAEDVAPALSDLKAALIGRRIKWLSDGLMKVAFLSASSTALAQTGLSIPIALIAGAGVSLLASGTMYRSDKKQSLRENPFAYLLSMERKLS